MSDLVLKGLDGANPLGFLAALGALVTANAFCPDTKIYWRKELGTWRPVLWGCDKDETEFSQALSKALIETSPEAFEFEKKLPFQPEIFCKALQKVHNRVLPNDRRSADLLSAFGSEIWSEKGVFQDTFFRMVRSGDSAGQGLPFYALAIRQATDFSEVHRTLFEQWDYSDKGYSLRWDPLEDQRYAMRWHDPSKNKDEYGLNSMHGANSLALEALTLFPTVPLAKSTTTTGFFRDKRRRIYFSWPIWENAISLEVIRSLLSLSELHKVKPSIEKLQRIGITEIYRCERIAPNQYYRNFAPAVSVA